MIPSHQLLVTDLCSHSPADPAALEYLRKDPCGRSGEGHAGRCGDEHQGEAFSKEEVHHHARERCADGAGDDVEEFARPDQKPNRTDAQTEGHLDRHIEERRRSEREPDERSEDPRRDIFLEAEDTADRDGDRCGELELRPGHDARDAEGTGYGDQDCKERSLTAVDDEFSFTGGADGLFILHDFLLFENGWTGIAGSGLASGAKFENRDE